MEALLHKAIEINSTTILPNFGAFMKMGKSVLFNEFLKYDDGKLAKVIADLEKISEDDAKNKITDWIESTVSKLDKGESITIPQVGVLIRDNGKLKFTASSESGASTPKPIVAVEEKKEEPKVSTAKEEPKEEVLKEVVTPIVKSPEKPVAKAVNVSTDFSAQDAIDKIKAFTNKSDLLDFIRDDKRKTVVDALNKKLDALNGKIVEAEKEDAVIAPIGLNKNQVTDTPKPEASVVEKAKEETPKVVTPVIETKVTNVTPPVVEKKIEEKVAPIVKKVEEKKEEKPPIVKSVEPTQKDKKPFTDKKSDSKANDKAIAAIAGSVDKTEKQLKKRKRRRIVLWLAIICLLAGGGIVGFLQKDVIMSYFEKKHEPKELADNTAAHKDDENNQDVPLEKEENVIEETQDAVEPVEEVVDPSKEEVVVEEPVIQPVVEEVTPVVTNSSSSGKYQIVAGSFSSEENANNKVESLKSKGYSSAKLLGKYGGLYTVRAMSFSSSSEAKEALKKFKADGNKGFVKKL